MMAPINPPTRPSTVRMPMTFMYPLKASQAARGLPVAAHVASGTMHSSKPQASANNRT